MITIKTKRIRRCKFELSLCFRLTQTSLNSKKDQNKEAKESKASKPKLSLKPDIKAKSPYNPIVSSKGFQKSTKSTVKSPKSPSSPIEKNKFEEVSFMKVFKCFII